MQLREPRGHSASDCKTRLNWLLPQAWTKARGPPGSRCLACLKVLSVPFIFSPVCLACSLPSPVSKRLRLDCNLQSGNFAALQKHTDLSTLEVSSKHVHYSNVLIHWAHCLAPFKVAEEESALRGRAGEAAHCIAWSPEGSEHADMTWRSGDSGVELRLRCLLSNVAR